MTEDLFVYNKKFETIGMIRGYKSLIWTRRFNEPGEYVLSLPPTARNIELIKYGYILCKSTDGEAAYIEDYFSLEPDGERTLEVSGGFLNSALRHRIITYTATADIKTVLDYIVTHCFINNPNTRLNVGNLRLMPYALSFKKNIAVGYKNKNMLEAITELCQDHNIGYKIVFNVDNKTYDFYFYEGRETPCVFSRNYKNVLSQDYYYQTSNHKTTAYVDYGGQTVTVGNEYTGWDRREIAVSGDTDSTDSAAQQGRAALLQYPLIQTLDNVLNQKSKQFVYKQDWDIGDIVTAENEVWNVAIKKNLLEITEAYDKGGLTIMPQFGNYVPVR